MAAVPTAAGTIPVRAWCRTDVPAGRANCGQRRIASAAVSTSYGTAQASMLEV